MKNIPDNINLGIPDNLKKNAFKVPEKYFDELPLKIQNKIDTGQNKVFRLFPSMQLKSAIVYSVYFILLCALIFTGKFFINNNSKYTLETEVLIDYLLYNDGEYEFLNPEDDILTLNNSNNSSEIIIEYLISENIDNSTIIENY